jgi:uncharacterized membrane protein YqiK
MNIFGLLGLVGAVALVIVLLVLLSGVRVIPNTRLGIVEKRFSPKGSIKSGFIALNGEAGFSPKYCAVHTLPMPIQCCPHRAARDIPQGKIGYIFARDGKLLDPTQTLASNVDVNDFQDVEGFLKNGGQRGRSVASSAKVRTRSTLFSSSSSPMGASIHCRLAARIWM